MTTLSILICLAAVILVAVVAVYINHSKKTSNLIADVEIPDDHVAEADPPPSTKTPDEIFNMVADEVCGKVCIQYGDDAENATVISTPDAQRTVDSAEQPVKMEGIPTMVASVDFDNVEMHTTKKTPAKKTSTKKTAAKKPVAKKKKTAQTRKKSK